MSKDPKKPLPEEGGITRRHFLSGIAGTAAHVGAFGILPAAALEACSSDDNGGTPPGGQPDGGSPSPDGGQPDTGTIADVKHVVILMQENRSFDHYFGMLKGVRGFGDRTIMPVKTNKSALYQPDATRAEGYLLPYWADTTKVNSQELSDTAHGWPDQHGAVNNGANDGWLQYKGDLTMAYFTRADIPFYYALAEAFTICDHYHCSVLGPTTPNRLHMWSGMLDADGKYGKAVTSNPDDYSAGITWKTYPARLQEAGVTWKVYYNKEIGDDSNYKNVHDDPRSFFGDYGDNPLWLFKAYKDALSSAATKDLADRAGVFADGFDNKWPQPASLDLGTQVEHVLADFIADCKAGTIPKVSFIVAPFAYSEHPAKRPAEGQAYTQAVLKALTSNADLWASTVLILNFDENDGFFDHVVPPIAPDKTPGEWAVYGTEDPMPVGLGVRVPMMAISPWSRGGWVNSQVHDHTSVIRFLEKWTGVQEPNISAWRRSITGDLTSCFDFTKKDVSIPTLPDAEGLRTKADTQSGLPAASPPSKQTVPQQEPGTSKARALPYQPIVAGAVDATNKTVTLSMANHGTAALQLLAVDAVNYGTPLRYDLAPAGSATGTVKIAAAGDYAISVHGPNRFLAYFAGSLTSPAVEVTPSITGDASSPKLTFTMKNNTTAQVTFVLTAGAYSSDVQKVNVDAGAGASFDWEPYKDSQGWYDVEVTIDKDTTNYLRHFSGRLENGRDGITGDAVQYV